MRVYIFNRDLGKAAGDEELKCTMQGNYKGVPELLWKQEQCSFMLSETTGQKPGSNLHAFIFCYSLKRKCCCKNKTQKEKKFYR